MQGVLLPHSCTASHSNFPHHLLPHIFGINCHVILNPFPLFLRPGRDSSTTSFQVPFPLIPHHPLTSCLWCLANAFQLSTYVLQLVEIPFRIVDCILRTCKFLSLTFYKPLTPRSKWFPFFTNILRCNAREPNTFSNHSSGALHVSILCRMAHAERLAALNIQNFPTYWSDNGSENYSWTYMWKNPKCLFFRHTPLLEDTLIVSLSPLLEQDFGNPTFYQITDINGFLVILGHLSALIHALISI